MVRRSSCPVVLLPLLGLLAAQAEPSTPSPSIQQITAGQSINRCSQCVCDNHCLYSESHRTSARPRNDSLSAAGTSAPSGKHTFSTIAHKLISTPDTCDNHLICWHSFPLSNNFKQGSLWNQDQFDLGGEARFRFHHEKGLKGPERFQSVTDTFLLSRLRLFADYRVNHRLRFYAEGLFSESTFQHLAPRRIDENFGDFSNAFIDFQINDNVLFRAGRQNLLFGAQRLVSTLDWANTRQSFEGIRITLTPSDWVLDGFFTHFVQVLPEKIDRADYERVFAGIYAVYNGFSDAGLDTYLFTYEDATTESPLYTYGVRLHGQPAFTSWHYEFETASQSSFDGTERFATCGVGYQFEDYAWQPTCWIYYDYASENYHHLYPLAHKYLGFIDAAQRSNISSPNVQLKMQPRQNIDLLLWYYHFRSATESSIPAIGPNQPTQNTNRDYGNELDFMVKWTFSSRSNLLLGYSHFWRGSKIVNPTDAQLFYMQWTVEF